MTLIHRNQLTNQPSYRYLEKRCIPRCYPLNKKHYSLINTHIMKTQTRKICLLIIISALSCYKLAAASVELINIDFTRDSIKWKANFNEPAWNETHTDYSIKLKKIQVENYIFKGTFGKFNPGPGVRAQPFYNADTTKFHRWAFRLDRSKEGNSYLELPVLANVGKFTVFCKNGNASEEGIFYIQKKEGDTWTTIRTMYVPPHYGRNYEMEMEEYLNINSEVNLRIAGATKNVHIFGFNVNAYDASIPSEKPLRLVLLPDPQAYANRKALSHIYAAQTLWIAGHSDSIKFVLCQGDMTQSNNDEQWSIAAGALSIMQGKKVSFTFVPGNHDTGEEGKTATRNTDMMNKYLPYSQYSRDPSFGGTFEEGKMENTWSVFSKGNYKFLILSLEFGPRNNVLDWAKTIIEQHPRYNVIINTHAYMFEDDTRLGSHEGQSGRPQKYGFGKDSTVNTVNDGQQIWDKVVKLYPNCLFVFSGHVTGRGIGHQVSEGVNGNKVYQFLANYQGGVTGTINGGNGNLRIVDLYPEQQSFSIKTYSPYTHNYMTEDGQHFLYNDVQFIKYEESIKKISQPKTSGKRLYPKKK